MRWLIPFWLTILSQSMLCDLVDALFLLAGGTFHMLFGLALVFVVFLSWTNHQNFTFSLFVTIVTHYLLLKYAHFL